MLIPARRSDFRRRHTAIERGVRRPAGFFDLVTAPIFDRMLSVRPLTLQQKSLQRTMKMVDVSLRSSSATRACDIPAAVAKVVDFMPLAFGNSERRLGSSFHPSPVGSPRWPLTPLAGLSAWFVELLRGQR